MQNIHDYISQTLADYKTHEVELADGLYWSQYDELKTLEYLITNHFEQGDSDPDTGLPKPFFDVITRLRLNQSSAEDIDIADLQLGADDPKYYTQAWVLSKFNRVWMKEGNMNDVLDDATLTRGDYGGVLLKVTENDEDLFIDVVNWHQIVTDPNDIPNGVKIEKHNFTPAELMDQAEERGWDVEKAQDAIATAENTMDDENSTDKRTLGKYVFVTELHGVLPVSVYLEAKGEAYTEEDEKRYGRYVFVTANSNRVRSEDTGDGKKGENLGVILYCEEEEKNPYYYLPYEVLKSRSLGRGTVEKAKHSQWWTNKAIKNEQDAMELAGKVFAQAPTGNKALKKNMVTGMKNGTVLEYTPGSPITALSLAPAGLGHFGNLVDRWNMQIERSTFTFAANTGETMPSGTPFRQTAMLNNEAGKPAGLRRDQMGELWKKIYRERVIPFLVKQARSKDKLAAEFTLEELRVLDDKISAWRGTRVIVNKMLNGKYDKVNPAARWDQIKMDFDEAVLSTKNDLAELGDMRWFGDFPEGFWDGVENHVVPKVSNTDRVKTAYLETISTILQTVAGSFDPNTGTFRILEDPTLRTIFEELMQEAGYSPLNLEIAEKRREAVNQGQQQIQPQQAQASPMQLPPELAQGQEKPAITQELMRQ
jgi:hypothetical protein